MTFIGSYCAVNELFTAPIMLSTNTFSLTVYLSFVVLSVRERIATASRAARVRAAGPPAALPAAPDCLQRDVDTHTAV